MSHAHELTRGTWVLRTQKALLSAAVTFSRDGHVIGGLAKARERWDLHEGNVRLMSPEGKVTAELSPQEDGSFSGPSLINSKNTIVLEPTTWEERPQSGALTRVQLKDQIARHGWSVGEHCYGKPNVIRPQGKLTIGKFVSFDPGVTIELAQRRTATVSTFPFQSNSKWWPNGQGTPDRTKKPVVIGNDVYIGTRAVITAGVTIGDGAVIGAQAVVRDDVEPYAIVEGNPAHVVGARFDTETIARLLAVAWWNWPDEAINEFLPLMGEDIATFLKEAERLGL